MLCSIEIWHILRKKIILFIIMKSIVKAVFTLTLFSMIDRLLGFVFKIYLSRELGATQIGIYQVALSVFFVLLTLTTSGIPLIVSKMTARFAIAKDKKSEHGTVTAALIVGLALSLVVCSIFLLFSDAIGKMFATKQSMTLLLFLLPGVLFSGIYAAFRGNLWGHQRYTAVSLIELLEQVVRIAVCVILFALGFEKLKVTAVSMSVACGVTALACAICYFVLKGKMANPKPVLLPLIKQSTPITLIRASSSVVNSLVAIAVPFLLVRTGMSVAESLAVYGASVGMAFPLLYIPITVVGSLAYVLIPTLSTAVAKNDTASVRKQIEQAISFSICIAALFVPIFRALGQEIGLFVYDNELSGKFLSSCAWLLIPVSVENITSSMMNSLDLEKSSFVNYAIGAAALFGIMFAFMGSFKIEIMIIGFAVSWTLSSVLDIIRIRKKTGIRLSFIMPLIKSVLLVFPCDILVRSLYSLIDFMPKIFSIGISSLVGLAFSMTLGLVFGIFDFSVFFSEKKKSQKKVAKKRKKRYT